MALSWSTYTSVGGRVLLVGRDDGSAALSGVQSRLALDDSLAGPGGATTGAATDLGDRVPVVHVEVWCGYEEVECGEWEG